MDNPVINHHPANLTATVSGDATIEDIQEILSENHQFIPIGPFDQNITVREVIDFNLLGCLCHKFGTIKKWLLNTKLKMENESIQTGSNVMKNVAGYDITRILIGAQGSLGKIKTATFKLYPCKKRWVPFISEKMNLKSAIEISNNFPETGQQVMNLNGDCHIIVYSDEVPENNFIEYNPSKIDNSQNDIRIVVLPSEINSLIEKIEELASSFCIFPSMGIVDVKLKNQSDKTILEQIGEQKNCRIFDIKNGIPFPRICDNLEYLKSLKKLFDPRNIFPEYKFIQ